MIGLEGNKDPDQTTKEKNTRSLVVLDDRKYGRTGKVPLFYDNSTGDFIEPPEGFLEDVHCDTIQEWEARNKHTSAQESDGEGCRPEF